MSKQPLPAPTASAVGLCPTIIQIVGRPGTGRLPRAIAPPDHPPQIVKLHGPSMFAIKAKIYKVLYKQISSIAFDETSSYWSALKSS